VQFDDVVVATSYIGPISGGEVQSRDRSAEMGAP